jgi:peptidyl-prolyl cis-trans isomerase D
VALSPRILRAAFAEDTIKQRRNTEALESSPGTLVSLRVDQYRAARLPALNEVRERVVGDHAEELAMAMAQKEGELLVRQINEASGDVRTLPAAGFSPIQRVTRQRGAGLDAASLNEVFRIPAEPAQKPRAAGLQLPGQGYRVLVLMSVVAADAGSVEVVSKAVAPQLASLEGGAMADAFVRVLRSQVKVETFPNRLSAQR